MSNLSFFNSFFFPCELKNSGNSLHGGATEALVDIVGSAVIFTMGAPTTGVSVEINVSYLDAAYAGVSELKTSLFSSSSFFHFCFRLQINIVLIPFFIFFHTLWFSVLFDDVVGSFKVPRLC